MSRYFIDERSGCIAVRDSDKTDVKYSGLHPDTQGVVRYWDGVQVTKTCPTCRHRINNGWKISDADKQAAVALCAELNKANKGDK
jgi:hypothetical protein